MGKAFGPSKDYESKLVKKYVESDLGIKVKQFKMCNVTSLNDTAADCPFTKGDFIVVIENPRSQAHNGIVKIPLTQANYEAEVFSKGNFIPVVYDVLENKHKDNVGNV